MSRLLSLMFVLVCIVSEAVMAEGGHDEKKAVEVSLGLGNSSNEMKFFPNSLEFKVGVLYKLIISNNSAVTHELDSQILITNTESHKMLVKAADGTEVAEIYGTPREIEVFVGGTVEWFFTPKDPGQGDMMCYYNDHHMAGMVGTVSIIK